MDMRVTFSFFSFFSCYVKMLWIPA